MEHASFPYSQGNSIILERSCDCRKPNLGERSNPQGQAECELKNEVVTRQQTVVHTSYEYLNE